MYRATVRCYWIASDYLTALAPRMEAFALILVIGAAAALLAARHSLKDGVGWRTSGTTDCVYASMKTFTRHTFRYDIRFKLGSVHKSSR